MERLRLALCNKNGMTLIEVMVSFLILTVVALAVMQSALLGMRTNLQNSLRDEAVSIADVTANDLRSLSFDDPNLASGTTTTTISRQFRAAIFPYTETQTVTSINSNNTKQIFISVSWLYSGKTFTHSVTMIVRRQ